MATEDRGGGAARLVELHALREEVAHQVGPLLGLIEERRSGGGDAEHVAQHGGVVRRVVVGQLEKADSLKGQRELRTQAKRRTIDQMSAGAPWGWRRIISGGIQYGEPTVSFGALLGSSTRTAVP